MLLNILSKQQPSFPPNFEGDPAIVLTLQTWHLESMSSKTNRLLLQESDLRTNLDSGRCTRYKTYVKSSAATKIAIKSSINSSDQAISPHPVPIQLYDPYGPSFVDHQNQPDQVTN